MLLTVVVVVPVFMTFGARVDLVAGNGSNISPCQSKVSTFGIYRDFKATWKDNFLPIHSESHIAPMGLEGIHGGPGFDAKCDDPRGVTYNWRGSPAARTADRLGSDGIEEE